MTILSNNEHAESHYVGMSVRRKEDLRLLRGKGTFLDDINPSGSLRAIFVRSTYSHAKVKSIDISRAKDMPGVVLVLTGKEIGGSTVQPRTVKPIVAPLLATDTVRYVGEPVALVVAKNATEAEDAAEEVKVEYEPLPVVVDPKASLDPSSPVLHKGWDNNLMLDKTYEFGDPEEAFASADIVIHKEFRMNRISAAPIECRGIVATFDKFTHEMNVWVSSQIVHGYRGLLAAALGLPENKMHVRVPDVGGAFGQKIIYPDEIAVCKAAMIVGDAVKWTEARSENLTSSSHARDQLHDVHVALRHDGTILAIKDDILADLGAYWSIVGWDPMRYTIDFITGPYKIRNCAYHLRCVSTNKAVYGAYRGFGMTLGNFVIERMMDIASVALGIDPVDIRRKNLIKDSEMPYTAASGVFYEANSFEGCLEQLVGVSGYEELRAWQKQARNEGRLVGIGISMQVESSTPNEEGTTAGLPGYESASVKIDSGGCVTIYTGLCPQGQSSETTLAQVAADELSIPLENVNVVYGDSSSCPPGFGTWGSRGATLGAATVIGACDVLKRKMMIVAEKILGLGSADLELASGAFRAIRDPSKSLTIKDIASICYFSPSQLPEGILPTLEATFTFQPPNINHPNSKGEANIASTYSNGANLAVLEVERESGMVKILRFACVHDCGNVINPAVVEGQIVGGILSGFGNALLEQVSYDVEGQPIGNNFLDYLIPCSADQFQVEIHHLYTPSPSIPGGFKGCGEGGAISTPSAIINAINDALSEGDQSLNSTPASLEAIQRMINRLR